MPFTTVLALDVAKTRGKNTIHSLPKPQEQVQKRKGNGEEGEPSKSGHFWPNLRELRLKALVPICLFPVAEFLLKMFYLSFSLGGYLEATLRTEIYSWIA